MELPERIEKLLASQRQLDRELEALRSSLTAKKSVDMLAGAQEIGGVRVLVTQVEADNPKVLREINDRFKEKLASGVVVLGAMHEDKAFLLVGVTSDLTKRVHAGNLVKEIARCIDGSGGGRPDMAQAGGTKPQGLAESLDLAKKLLKETLS